MKTFLRLAMTLCVILLVAACSQPRNGVDGISITGPQGPAGADGSNGIDGTNGTDGAAGANGTNGTNGTNGRDGVDATPTTIVQLCPGTPSYPAHFVEVGICLQGNLYGVYSANGGFLTLLPPGRYTSNGIGSACDFTVGANCAVVP